MKELHVGVIRGINPDSTMSVGWEVKICSDGEDSGGVYLFFSHPDNPGEGYDNWYQAKEDAFLQLASDKIEVDWESGFSTKIYAPTHDERCIKFDGRHWYLEIRNQVYALNEPDTKVSLGVLPFMELRLSEILAKTSGCDSPIPIKLFILSGFRQGTPHWVSCSLSWLQDGNITMDDEIERHLKHIFKMKKKYSQSIRHKAHKILQRINH